LRHPAILCVALRNSGRDWSVVAGSVGEKAPMKDEVCSWTLVERNMLGTGGGDGDRGRFEDMFGIPMELGFLVGLVVGWWLWL
jgi:hypothetical protein